MELRTKARILSMLLVFIAGLSVISLLHLNITFAANPSKAAPGSHAASASRVGQQKLDSAPADWSQFHGDAARDGSQSTNTMLSKSNAGTLLPVSGPAFTTTGQAMSSPSIYQGLLYYAANSTLGNINPQRVSTMYAVDAMTGQIIWSKTFPDCGSLKKHEYVFSTAAITTGMINGVATPEVFIGWGSNGYKANGCIYDFNGLTGAVIWTYATHLPVLSSPAIMTTNSGTIVVVGDNNDYVHAFSVNYTGKLNGTGVQLWNYDDRKDQPPTGYQAYCLPAPENCGDAVWSSPAEGLVQVNGATHHYAYFGIGAGTNTVGRIDAIDLDIVNQGMPTLSWAFWDPHPYYDDDFGTILVLSDASNQARRVFTGMHNGDMYALNAINGTMYFDFSTSAQLGNIQTMVHSTGALVTINGTTELIFGAGCSPTLDYDVCTGPNNGHIWALDALSTVSSGTLLWESQDFGGDIVSSPAIVNQGANAVAYILGPWSPGTTMRGDLLALDPLTGAILGDYPILNNAYGGVGSPAIYGGRIYVTEGYSIYARPAPVGGVLAAFKCAGCL